MVNRALLYAIIEIEIFGLNVSDIDFTLRITCIMLCNYRQKGLYNTPLLIILGSSNEAFDYNLN